MKNNLTESQIKILITLNKENEIGYKDLAEKSNLSYDGVRGRISELGNLGYKIDKIKKDGKTVLRYKKGKEVIPSAYIKPISVNETLNVRGKSLKDFCEIVDFLDELRTLKSKKEISIVEDKGKKYACMILSDIHFGEKIIDPITNKEVFNTGITHKRMEILTKKLIFNLKAENINHLTIAIIGDVIDGDMIYRNHLFRVDKPAVEQIQDGVRAISKLIKTILKHIKTIEVHCVRGNHGVTNYINLEEDNWDNVVYDMLGLVFVDNKNVKINHYKTNEARIKLGNKTAIIMHGRKFGDQIKTATGAKTFRGICAKHKLTDGDMVFVGDLHTFGIECDQSKYLIRNGSIANASEYAFKFQLYSEPEQTLLILEDPCLYPKIIPIEVI